ncbi:MAG: hypothetical protein KAJ19_28185 [Gammaproteobacteria bacterium]|nr:hypothetical protein [Gammaproteobacteria bacterium]
MTVNTDGTTPAAEGVTGTPPEPTVTQPVVDNTGRDAEGRIAGLVAERERFKTALEKEKAERAAEQEKYKSDEDKRIDQLVTERVESEYGPVRQRLERIEVALTAKRDKLLESLPEDSRDCYDEGAPVEVQVRQIELVTSHLSTHSTPSILDSGGNPAAQPSADKTRYSRADYQEVQRLATQNPAEFDKVWPTMKKALLEGRIDGVNPGGIQIRT